jgi:hypothetical protein
MTSTEDAYIYCYPKFQDPTLNSVIVLHILQVHAATILELKLGN